MNRALLRLSLACLAMFVLLLININYVQAFEATSLAGKPGNSRTFYQQFQYQRGSIVANGDGTNLKIAESRLVKGGNGTYQRVYPDGPVYAPVTGYDSIFSATGMEAAEDKVLSGTAPQLQVHNLISLITGKQKQGATVALTISPRAQQAAYQALAQDGGHSGAVVAIDPSTGAILAMASYPTFNPNNYVTLNGTQLQKVDSRYRADPAQPLLNRAIEATYPPGSTFKIVTSSAAFATHTVAGPNTPVPAPTNLPIGNGHVLINDANEVCANGNPPFIQAFWLSCNTAFGKLGIKLTGAVLHQYANAFGVNNPNLKIPLPVAASVVPLETDPAFTAFTAIGQFDDQVTPLQEAMFSAAIADGGTLMTPHLVQSVQAPDLSTIESATPTPLSHPDSPTVASKVAQMMVQVTQNPAGTAFGTANASIVGVVIAGKTGTAQNGINNTNLDDAVFTCFAPATNPRIAVGVIVKGGGFGSAAAAPIAVKVIQAYLKVK
ncbi:MAG TPA: penicillin-binding transpeptidase domain-containing protein [Streptosporangiaceae bacterium]|nr:penicillin-binding transpeptidase domain-containing protein [Streptosporangiaceae bacterium]